MSMGVGITLEGIDELIVANMGLSLSESRRANVTIKRAMASELKTGLRPIIQQHVKRRLRGNKLWRSYTGKAETGISGNPELVIYSRVDAVVTHEKGMAAPIKPRKGKYLAIPTDFAMTKLRGRIPGGSKVTLNKRLKPRHLKNTFWGRSRKGNLVLFQKIVQTTPVSKYLKRAKGKLQAGEVLPMFTMVKLAVLPKRTDVYGVCVRHMPHLANAIINALIRQFNSSKVH